MPESLETRLPPDPVIEYYKQFVDRDKLRENLRRTVDERLQRLELLAAQDHAGRRTSQPSGPETPWEAISDCSPNRTTDPIIELYKRDVDRTLLRENLRRTQEQRLQTLASMARFVGEFQAARRKACQS